MANLHRLLPFRNHHVTIQDRIIEYLAVHPEGVDDDALVIALGLRQRQQANQRCRRLEKFGIVCRRVVCGKIHNFLNPDAPQTRPTNTLPPVGAERPWNWEGNVQARVVTYLREKGYSIVSTADTATKQQGKDIVAADPHGCRLWVSANGYPIGTLRTNPRTQARHWFAHALFDLVLWHNEDSSLALGLALPEETTYLRLTDRSRWFFNALNARIFWVREPGGVFVQEFRIDHSSPWPPKA